MGYAAWLAWKLAQKKAPKLLKYVPKPSGIKLPKIPKGKELLPTEKVAAWEKGINPAFSPKDILLSSTIADGIANLPPVKKATEWGGEQIWKKGLTPLGRGIDNLLPGINSADERKRKGYSSKEFEAAYTLPEDSSLELQKRAGTQPRTWQDPYGTGADIENENYKAGLEVDTSVAYNTPPKDNQPTTIPEQEKKMAQIPSLSLEERKELNLQGPASNRVGSTDHQTGKGGWMKKIGSDWKNSPLSSKLGAVAGLLKIAGIIGAKDQQSLAAYSSIPLPGAKKGKSSSKGVTGTKKDEEEKSVSS